MTANFIWTLEVAAIIVLFAACIIVAIHAFFRWCAAEVERHVQAALDDDTVTIDVYGPRVMYGPLDDDREWDNILAIVGLTEPEVRARYEAAQIPDPVDEIRADVACARLRREIESFDGGVS